MLGYIELHVLRILLARLHATHSKFIENSGAGQVFFYQTDEASNDMCPLSNILPTCELQETMTENSEAWG